jgi:apolipoprotein D and lipocalin family protein
MPSKKATIILSIFFLSCQTMKKDLAVVDSVDLKRYAGTWFEIAKLPNSFEKGLKCVKATYSIRDDGKIQVINEGINVKKDDKHQTIKGVAYLPDKTVLAKLKVRFFWPFSGNYWIIDLDKENYQYALIGEPSRKYLWILCRSKIMDDALYTRLINKAKEDGFDTSRVEMTLQE